MALVVEESPSASLVLAALGFTPETWHPRCIGTTSMAEVPSQVRNGRYGLVWLNMPSSPHSVSEKRWTSTIASMAQWARSARRAGVPVALTGLRGRCWKHPEVGSLLSDKVLHET